MGAMTVRNLDPKVVAALRKRAAARGRSLNSLVVEILTEEALREQRRERLATLIPRMDALREKIAREFPVQTPSEILIREGRDER
jgi:plasmid stability protein